MATGEGRGELPGNFEKPMFTGVLQGRSWFSFGYTGIVCLEVEFRWEESFNYVPTLFRSCGARFTSLRRRHMERTLAFECFMQGVNPLVLHDGGDTPQMLPEHNA